MFSLYYSYNKVLGCKYLVFRPDYLINETIRYFRSKGTVGKICDTKDCRQRKLGSSVKVMKYCLNYFYICISKNYYELFICHPFKLSVKTTCFFLMCTIFLISLIKLCVLLKTTLFLQIIYLKGRWREGDRET